MSRYVNLNGQLKKQRNGIRVQSIVNWGTHIYAMAYTSLLGKKMGNCRYEKAGRELYGRYLLK